MFMYVKYYINSSKAFSIQTIKNKFTLKIVLTFLPTQQEQTTKYFTCFVFGLCVGASRFICTYIYETSIDCLLDTGMHKDLNIYIRIY